MHFVVPDLSECLDNFLSFDLMILCADLVGDGDDIGAEIDRRCDFGTGKVLLEGECEGVCGRLDICSSEDPLSSALKRSLI